MAALPYSTRTCITGCTSFDAHYQSCNTIKSDKLAQCVCTFGGDPTPYTGALNACTVCNAADLGANNLTTYQSWAVVCNTYVDEGDAAAEVLADSPNSAALVAIFSSTLLPQLQSQALQTPTPTIGPVSLTGSSTKSRSIVTTTSVASPGTTATLTTSSATTASTAVSSTSAVSPAATTGMAVAGPFVPGYLGFLGICAVMLRGL